MDAGEAVFAIAFSDGMTVDHLPGTVRADRRANTAADAGIGGEDDLFGTGDRRPLTVTPGGTVIPLADHPVHLGDRQDIILALVNGRENGCDFLGNQLILRVRHFPGRVKIRQVGVDHLNRIDVIHLETVLLGQIVHELREDRAMGAESADGEEIIGLECGTGDEVLHDCRRDEAVDRADEADFFRLINRILIVDFLRDAQQGGLFSCNLA